MDRKVRVDGTGNQDLQVLVIQELQVTMEK